MVRTGRVARRHVITEHPWSITMHEELLESDLEFERQDVFLVKQLTRGTAFMRLGSGAGEVTTPL